MPLVLDATWVGRRIVLRQALGPVGTGRPRFTDVVGELLTLDDAVAVLDTRTGPVTVAVGQVAIAKLVQPSRAEILALEAITERGWRAADRAEIGGWLLRANQGFTGRANTVLPLRQPDRPLDELIGAARSWYRERGLQLGFQLALPARRVLDQALAERGFHADVDVAVLARRLDDTPADAPPVEITDLPTQDWLARCDYHGRQVPSAGRDLLVRHPRVGFASIRRGDEPVAIARGAVDEGWLGVTALHVDPAARRQGLASAIMRGLWRWAMHAHDATHSYLQVSRDNSAALALYQGLGYWHHHDYRYRTQP